MEGGDDIDARLARLERRIDRERNARREAESLLEEKSWALYQANLELSRFASELEHRVAQRTRELQQARELALQVANLDQLTGLANRSRFQQKLDDEIREASRDGGRFALLMMDLDRFKEINDTLGHYAGDVFLRETAARLVATLGESALVSRLGGDEFAIILPGVGQGKTLDRIASDLIEVVSRPVPHQDWTLHATGSLGIALFPGDASNAGDLQRFADIALYKSKHSRAAFTFYDVEMGREIDARRELETELASAIRSDVLEAWFQPIVDAATRRVIGVEALARWPHPTRGVLAPGAFIGLAEERGLMPELFSQILRSACLGARPWIELGAIKSLSVNVSPSQFKLGCVADAVAETLRELEFPPEALTVEITEEILTYDFDRARDQLARLKALGVRVALDDFGVGYSNIGYLTRVSFDVLKLDRSLVADLTSERKVRSILGALVELARALDLELVAEGVEEDAQALWLAHVGCRRLQGYLFGQPKPAAAIDDMLRAQAVREPGGPKISLQRIA